jgi:hypothetical protein
VKQLAKGSIMQNKVWVVTVMYVDGRKEARYQFESWAAAIGFARDINAEDDAVAVVS